MNPRNAVHVVLSENVPPTWGGVARVAYNLSHALGQDGYETLLCGFDRYVSHPLYGDEPFRVLPISSVGWRKRKDWVMATLLWRIRKTCGGRPVILYALTWKLARVARFVVRPLGWKLLVFAHGLEVTRQRSRGKRRAMMGVFHGADLCLGVSRYTADLLVGAGVSSDRVRVLNNGVDPGMFYPLTHAPDLARVRALRHRLGCDKGVMVLTLARVIERKGQDSVIRALARLAERRPQDTPPLRYVIAGRGPTEEVRRLKDLADRLGVKELVVFWGYVDPEQMLVFYNACDIYVMNSRIVGPDQDVEGFGITFLEAGACGKPVIGGRSGGVVDAIDDGRSGFLVDPEDPDALANRLEILVSNPELRARMGAEGLRRARNEFSIVVAKDRLLEMIRQLPNKAGRPRSD
jgi:phosphatidylinositol alpha-1,6-mannosyltransferase